MDYKKANEVSNTLLVCSIIAFGATFFISGTVGLAVGLSVGVLLIIAAIVLRILFWRCPHCKKRLPLGFRMEPTLCPYCKQKLLNEES